MAVSTAWVIFQCIGICKTKYKEISWRCRFIIVVYPILMFSAMVMFIMKVMVTEIKWVLTPHSLLMQSTFFIMIYYLEKAKITMTFQIKRVMMFVSDIQFNAILNHKIYVIRRNMGCQLILILLGYIWLTIFLEDALLFDKISKGLVIPVFSIVVGLVLIILGA